MVREKTEEFLGPRPLQSLRLSVSDSMRTLPAESWGLQARPRDPQAALRGLARDSPHQPAAAPAPGSCREQDRAALVEFLSAKATQLF